uniref:FHA domain-containing protein n=1 Tax=Soboliphyme baturini TaxID=241478 RepID=A0A183J193_9BILA
LEIITPQTFDPRGKTLPLSVPDVQSKQFCDFAIDHASCSRVHAALLYHKHLNRAFLVDLGSTHGTFIGTVRLEAYKPEQLLLDQVFHFGASSRRYILRERPSGAMSMDETEALILEGKSYNTALNRRIATMTVPEEDFKTFKRKHHAYRVSFNDEEEIINPEDIDPTIGRFRNLVETALISRKVCMPVCDFHNKMISDLHHYVRSEGSKRL